MITWEKIWVVLGLVMTFRHTSKGLIMKEIIDRLTLLKAIVCSAKGTVKRMGAGQRLGENVPKVFLNFSVLFEVKI